MAEHYSGKKAAEIVGISYRQLDYWARTDLVRPSVADASGSGTRRRYGYRDLLELKVIKTLLDNGIKLESVRQAFTYLRDQLGEDVASAQLIISGGSAILVRDDDELIDVETTNRRIGVRFEVEPSRPLGIATWRTTGAVRNIRLWPVTPIDSEP